MGDINGAWLGTYWQSGLPTRFEATFVQTKNTLSGSILDDSPLGEAKAVGTIAGRSITFTKRYILGHNTAISYSGTLSEDGNHINGQWRIDHYGSGPWEAHRSNNDLAAELEQRQAKPAAVAATAAT
ncbi:MAG: hypothetical protein AAF728_01145 [Cyanobacteria bacterium P01_D01_bin.128]